MTSSLQTDTTSQPILYIMSEQLVAQVRELLKHEDEQSLKYIIGDEQPSVVKQICAQLTASEVIVVQRVYKQARPEQQPLELGLSASVKKQKNKNIDEYLLELRENNQESRQQTFLEMLSKINQKLIYQEHFGFPFYDLLKRIITTHGDLHPLVLGVKAMHSQVQILYEVLFSEEALNTIKDRSNSYQQGFKAYFELIFPKEYQQYTNFISVYKNIKKSTEEEQSCDEQSQNQEIPLNQDQTLEHDEKQFLVKLAEGVPIEEFHQFTKNRSYNFLCFGLKKYLLFLSISEQILKTVKEKEFAEIMSFFTIRFIRKILFAIIRQRGEGKLVNLTHPITPQEIKIVGNELVDQITGIIQKYCLPVKNIEEEAQNYFIEEFETMSYRDFMPRKYISQAMNKGIDPAKYAWSQSKEYRTLWSQRVKAERYVKTGAKGPKPLLEYVDYVLGNKEAFQANGAALWKKYIMNKFGFESEVKVIPSKRIKLSSLND